MANQHSGHSQEGKDILRRNSLKHGILSTNLFLDGEDSNQFDELHNNLRDELNPVGIIEGWLVHQLAMNIWRQIRLLKAEKASIELQRHLELPKNQEILKENTGLVMPQSTDPSNGATSSKEKTAEQSTPAQNQDIEQRTQAFLADYDRLSPLRDQLTDFEQLGQMAPHLVAFVRLMVQTHSGTLEEQAQKLQDGFWYWADLIAGNLRMKASAGTSSTGSSASEENASTPEPTVATDEIIRLVKTAYSAPFNLPLLGRYSTMLNNEFYKTLKALREEQERRLKTIQGSTGQPPSI